VVDPTSGGFEDGILFLDTRGRGTMKLLFLRLCNYTVVWATLRDQLPLDKSILEIRDPTLWKIHPLGSKCTRTKLRPRKVLRKAFFGERLCDFLSARIIELKVNPAIIRSSAPCNLHLISSQGKPVKILIESVYGVDQSSQRTLKVFLEKRLDLDEAIADFAR
jgi:hypothetical protein